MGIGVPALTHHLINRKGLADREGRTGPARIQLLVTLPVT
jgi:hypothetical protein